MAKPDVPKPLSKQQEANALMSYAFARGFLRVNLLANKLDSDEMMKVFIDTSIAIGELTEMRATSPSDYYEEVIRMQHKNHCKHWDKH